MEKNSFLNKHCKLVRADGFVLFGIIRDITPSYVLIETDKKASMIGFIDIKELSLDPRYYGGGYR